MFYCCFEKIFFISLTLDIIWRSLLQRMSVQLQMENQMFFGLKSLFARPNVFFTKWCYKRIRLKFPIRLTPTAYIVFYVLCKNAFFFLKSRQKVVFRFFQKFPQLLPILIALHDIVKKKKGNKISKAGRIEFLKKNGSNRRMTLACIN